MYSHTPTTVVCALRASFNLIFATTFLNITHFQKRKLSLRAMKTLSKHYLARRYQSSETNLGGLASGPSPSTMLLQLASEHLHPWPSLATVVRLGLSLGPLLSLCLIVYYVCTQASTLDDMPAQVVISRHSKHLLMLASNSKESREQRRGRRGTNTIKISPRAAHHILAEEGRKFRTFCPAAFN